MSIAIVGGGFLGSAVAAASADPVLVVTRSGRRRRGTATDVVALDVLRAPIDEITSTLGRARKLVIAIAPGRDQDRRELYVEGTRRVLEATRDVAWERIVFVGSTSAIGDHDGWVDESSAALPTSERGLVQRDAEAVALAHPATIVLRLGGLYGPGRPIGQFHRRDNAPLPGDGNVATNLVHLDDAVQAALAALAAPPSVHGVVHVCADDHTPYRTLYARVGADVRYEREPDPNVPARGKRVSNLRLKALLGVRLLHPTSQ